MMKAVRLSHQAGVKVELITVYSVRSLPKLAIFHTGQRTTSQFQSTNEEEIIYVHNNSTHVILMNVIYFYIIKNVEIIIIRV